VKHVLSVSIVPLHDPYHLARSVMTIDHFSNGRFVFGIGTGWLREEFDIVGAPWDRRGARTEEMLELMKRLWTEPTIEHHGEFYDLPPSGMEPKPIVQPHPPYVFGGSSTVALRRAARLGDGWFGVGLDVDEAATVVARLRELRADAGRPDPLEISINWPWPLTDELVDALSAAGVDRLVVRPWERGRDAVDRLVALAHQLSIPAPT
jgi:probable F420-dependent oxidoreductase